MSVYIFIDACVLSSFVACERDVRQSQIDPNREGMYRAKSASKFTFDICKAA